MITCLKISLVLLTFLCPGGCPVYDFDVKTIGQPSEFSNNLKLQADLNTEMAQGLLGINEEKDSRYDGSSSNRNDDKLNTNDDVEETKDLSNRELELSVTKQQRACNKKKKGMLDFVGTNLFDGNRKKCFTSEEIALLTARRDFDLLLPKDLPQCLLNDDMVCVFMQYFYGINQVIQRMKDECAKSLTEKAFYDTLGGYLKYYLLPVTKFSYYAGKVNLKTVDNVIALYQQCKNLLNTNGNGWKAPMLNVLTELKNVHIEPLKFGSNSSHKGDNDKKDDHNESKESAYCTRLDLSSVNSDAEEDQMIVSLPKLEAEDCDGFLGNIWLPFKRKRTFDLRARKSAFIVVKFFETVTRCYHYQCLCQDAFNTKFKAWIMENVQLHLSDEQFYPGLGAILRISENLKRNKKATSNYDYDEENDGETRFNVMNSEARQLRSKMNDGTSWIHGKRGHPSINNKSQNDDAEQDDGEMEDDEEIDGEVKVKVECPVKPFVKQKNKKKCKKVEEEPKENELTWYQKIIEWMQQKRVIKWFCYFIFFLLLLLLLILICAMLARRKPKPKPVPIVPVYEEEKEPPPSPACVPKKRRGLCDCFRKRKRNADDEMLINPDNSSVLPVQCTSSSSSSVLAFQPRKCIPIHLKCTKSGRTGDTDKSDAAIIETTSMDYSSSEPEEKASTSQKGNKSKVVTIDEKKNKRADEKNKRLSLNNDEKNKRSNQNAEKRSSLMADDKNKRSGLNSDDKNTKRTSLSGRVGMQRNSLVTDAEVKSNETENEGKKKKPRDKLHSTSWETMYET